MSEEAALQASRIAGIATMGIGTALVVAPGRVGPLAGLSDPRTARAIGLLDVALAPGLLVGTPRWPWLAARATANVVTAVVVARGGWAGRATALSLAVLTVYDATAASALYGRRR